MKRAGTKKPLLEKQGPLVARKKRAALEPVGPIRPGKDQTWVTNLVTR